MRRHFLVPNLLAALLVFWFSFAGCSSSYSVRPSEYMQVNEEWQDRQVTIELKSGEEIIAEEVRLSEDSLWWRNMVTEEESGASIQELDTFVIVTTDHMLGALEGLGLGVLIGGGLGAAVFADSHFDGPAGWFVGLVFGTAVGGGLGLITGAFIGHSNNHEVKWTSAEPRLKIPVARSSADYDILYLKNGAIVRGTIIGEIGEGDYLDRITIRNERGELVTYKAFHIDRIEKGK